MPIKFSDTETKVYRPAPALGEHNEEVYTEMLGYDAAQLAELKEKGII
jgi:crotonobetainyl-CoA:carnitine CoA-transferase CaiB-like acyl-CoA transferase